MLVVVRVEAASAEAAGILVASEARRVVGTRLDRVEVRFGSADGAVDFGGPRLLRELSQKILEMIVILDHLQFLPLFEKKFIDGLIATWPCGVVVLIK